MTKCIASIVCSFAVAAGVSNSSAQTFSTLASFNGTNGENPQSGLTLSGNTLYGTTSSGGAANKGTVFSVPITGGTLTTLGTFNGSNGSTPTAGLIILGNNLYGTTGSGGAANQGTVFSVPITGGTLTTLGTFNGSNGTVPGGGVIVSGSTLYGTTVGGGPNGTGSVFSIPVSGGTINTLASLFGTFGRNPRAGLTLSGNTLYGTTELGGTTGAGFPSGGGAIFSVSVTGGPPNTLATFTGPNGLFPRAGLILSGTTLYGTTRIGGASNLGTVFSIPLSGGSPTTLATFTGINGSEPYAGLTLLGNTLYGTTRGGGTFNLGTVFSVPVTGGAPTTLVTFNGDRGAYPSSGLTLSGNTLYGTTSSGGTFNLGTVFALVIPSADTDKDGILDDWEVNGVPYTRVNGMPGRYMLLGANPLKKDIFVEVDAMSGRAPSGATLQRVIDAFDPPRTLVPAVAGVPGALSNITLHIDTDPADLGLTLVNGGDYTQGRAGFGDFGFDKARYFGSPLERTDPDWGTPASPGPKQLAKRSVYRYCIFANSFSGTTNSGVAKGIPSNDFMVTLGSFSPPGGSQDDQAATFMHELGHTLGLRHGGGPANRTAAVVNGVQLDGNDGRGTLADVNWRPNHYSVMNYWWQLRKPWQGTAWGLRYSEAPLPLIDENALSESAGLGASLPGVSVPYRVAATSTCQGVHCDAQSPSVCHNLASLAPAASVDWNGDCLPTTTPIAVDLNDFSDLLGIGASTAVRVYHGQGHTVLEGHHDWANLIYDFRTSPTYAPGSSAEPDTCDFSLAISAFLDSIPAPCQANFDGTGGVTADDIFAFLDAWFAQNGQSGLGLSADFNADQSVTADDIFAFLDAWFAQNGVCGV